MLRAKVRKVTTSHVDASEVLTIFEDTQGKKLRKIAIPAVEYTTPDGRSVTRDECLAAATAHWGEILEASRYCRQVQSVCPDYAHFMISRYSCLEAYLSAQGVGDTSRMRLVVIERAIAMLEDIKTHYGSKETLAEKLAYVLRLEGRFADWMIDVKAMFFSRVIAVATVSHQLDLHHIHEAIRQLEKMRHAALFAKHLAESVLRPPEFFLLRSYPEDLTY
ncbi:hypothetical protein CYR55_23005 [Chimaeribacter californicus]|uniref:Uncharacterized protein n=2 Tax=Chimaeribacter californicus TaxID=2060067 RepID=A0A2N5DSP3_9GAMM|nr:hypothetical protein CYR55_23005 [Chimaeribacter californicus]